MVLDDGKSALKESLPVPDAPRLCHFEVEKLYRAAPKVAEHTATQGVLGLGLEPVTWHSKRPSRGLKCWRLCSSSRASSAATRPCRTVSPYLESEGGLKNSHLSGVVDPKHRVFPTQSHPAAMQRHGHQAHGPASNSFEIKIHGHFQRFSQHLH